MILKKIKETPDIHQEMKNKICGRLLLIFKSPPVSNYTQLPMLEQGNFNISDVKETLEEQGFCVWRVNTPSVLFISWMKPVKDIKDVPKPPRSGPDYRPFVYDESAFAFLTRQ